MANYYTDHPEFEFYRNHPEMKRIVELKERNFADKDEYADAPVDSTTLSRTISACSRLQAILPPT